MDNITKRQIKSYILDYLKKRISNFEVKGKMFSCLKCGQVTANIFPPTSFKAHCYDPKCGSLGDIFDISRQMDFDGNKDVSDEDIAKFLIKEFKIQTDDRIEKILAQYSEWEWSLFPVTNDGKVPIQQKWTEKIHKDLSEWKQWQKNGSNLGVRTGEVSNITVIDVDLITKEESEIWQKGTATQRIEKIKRKKEDNLAKLKSLNLFNETVMQDSGWKGIHYFYLYEADIPKCSFDYEDLHFDVENNGGYILVEPSIFAGKTRKITGTTINKMSDQVKELILSNTKKAKKEDNKEENISSQEGLIKGLEGCCNSRFVQVGGMFRKIMNVKQTEQALGVVNKYMLDDPMDYKAMKAMTQQIEKYYEVDIDAIGLKILEHLRVVGTAHIRDLRECLGFDRKDLEVSLKNLCDNRKLYKIKKDLFKLIQDVEWREDFLALSKPLNFRVPYFDEFASFNNGSMIVIGAKTGTGKSILAVNIIEQFIKQGICPKLITTESDSGVGETALARGLKEGDFKFWPTADPTAVPFYENEVRIIDWLRAPDSDFTKLDSVYQRLSDNLTNFGGLLIVFAQLKKENGNFYAENMVEQFASLVAKFLYTEKDGAVDNLKPYFTTTKIRRPKLNKQYLTIPLQYDYETKKVEIVK